MLQDYSNDQVIELTKELSNLPSVWFDGEKVRLEGYYPDQLSAYRAKKIWVQTLQTFFLLEHDQDISCHVESREDEGLFALRCDFLSACARYAFWRLTNEQTPEVQYIIETAHIPQCESRRYDFLTAAELNPVDANTSLIERGEGLSASKGGLLKSFKRLLGTFSSYL